MINHPNRSKRDTSGPLLAYHGDDAIKTAIMAQLAGHREADEIVKGHYWEDGKGCAVGCTVHSGNHAEYEPRFGIPQVLARLEDRIFEGLPNDKAKEWPERFMGAIKPGADLSQVWPKFAAWLLVDETFGVIRFTKTDEQRAIMNEIAAKYLWGDTDRAGWRDLWERARKIRNAADAYAYAAYAAYADAYAAYAADAYAAAAYAAYADAADAYAAAAYAYAARSKHYVAESDKLIELLQAA